MQTESEQLFEESKKYIPGGVNSPVRAFGSVGRSPIFIKKAKGSRIFDEDGREYIDYVCSWGPGILGHAKETVIEAVKAACDDGLTFGAPTRKELEIAELITAHMPSMEMSRMVNSGTEAVMSAIRAARGFTGRDYIVKFKGCYHGHSDGLLVKAGSGVITQTVANSACVPEGYAKYTLVAEYNDEESVKQLFNAYKGQIAAIIVEPVAANMGVVPPKAGFLEFLRDITQTDGALLIFDEVITGFRLAPGGAQEYFHIKPDLTTLGKIVGGGMPVGTYGGRREIMQCVAPLGEVYQAGTLSGNPIAMTAGIETLKLLTASVAFPVLRATVFGVTATACASVPAVAMAGTASLGTVISLPSLSCAVPVYASEYVVRVPFMLRVVPLRSTWLFPVGDSMTTFSCDNTWRNLRLSTVCRFGTVM